MKRLLLRSFTLMTLCLMATGPTWADDVASIKADGTTTNYATLQAAFDAVQSNQTITLLGDASGDGVMLKAADAKTGITLDLQNHTYTVSGKLVGSTGTVNQAFHFEKGWGLTIKDGTLTATYKNNLAMIIQNYANLTLENVTVDGSNKSSYYTAYGVISVPNGSLTTSGTTKITAATGSSSIRTYYYPTSYPDGFTVSLGSGTTLSGYINYQSENASEGWTEKAKITVADNVDLSNVGFNYADGVTPNIVNAEGTNVVEKTEKIAKVGNVWYSSIEAAYANGANNTVYIYKAGTYTLPDLSLTKMDINGLNATEGDVLFDLSDKTEAIPVYNTKFNGVKFKLGNKDGVGFKSDKNALYFYKCEFDGQLTTLGSATTYINGCTFDQSEGAEYCVLAQAKQTTFQTYTYHKTTYYTTFNCDASEAVKLYVANNDDVARTVSLNSCKFNATNSSTMPAVMIYTTDSGGKDVSYTLNYSGSISVSENFKATADIVKEKASDNLWGVNNANTEACKVTKSSEQVFPSLGDLAEIDGTKYQTFNDALNAVTSGKTIKLLRGFTMNLQKTLGNSKSLNEKSYTLDLNGQSIAFSQLSIYDNLTITDSNAEKTGNITSTQSGARPVWVYGTVNITGGNITSTTDNKTCTPLTIAKGGICTISGGTISTTVTSNYGAVQVQSGGTLTVKDGATILSTSTASTWGESGNSAINAGNGSTLTIEGGNISATKSAVYATMYNTNEVNISGGTFTGDKALFAGSYTINITGGTFNGTSYAVYAYRPNVASKTQTISISGGNFSATGTDGKVIYNASDASYGPVNISVIGGYFNDKASVKDYLAEGYGLYDNTDNSYPYKVDKAEAVIGDGETYYKTLAEAITAATNGQTVTLLKSLTSSVTISGKQITLDLGEKTLTSAGETIDNGIPAIFVNSGANVTLQNGTVAANANGYRDVIVKNGSTLTVKNTVTMTSNGDGTNYCISVRHGDTDANTINIEGGTFTTTGYAIAYVGAKNNVNISGGTYNAVAGLFGNGTTGYSGNNVNITGGDFTVSEDGFYFPNNDIVNISKCSITVTGEGQGIVARAGKVTLGKDVAITTQGTKQANIGDNKTELSSSAVVFDALANYSGLQENASSVINITGGTYKSGTGIAAVKVESSTTNTGKYMAVSGGSFSSQLTSEVCATGYAPVTEANTDGTYGVKEDDNAASTYISYTTEKDGQKTFLDGNDITLTDGDYYSFNVPTDMTSKNITYTRNFENAVWSCWFMPFDISVTANSNVTFYKLYATLLDDDGEWYISAKEVESGTILANVPYLIKPKETGEQTFSVTGTTVYSTTSSTRPQKEAKVSSVSQNYTFTGIYTKKTPTDSDLNWYALAADGNFSQRTQVSDNLALKPFRFFLTITDKEDDIYSSGSKSNGAKPNHTIKIIESGSSTTTGIEETLNGEENTKDKMIYDLQGRRVTKPVKGLYIVNGKKVIIK